jgi:hypothetical protein
LQAADAEKALNTTRFQDTPDAKVEELKRYLDMKCGHKGKMNGHTWGDILKNNYRYYLFSVGNCMGRDTRSFRVFFQALRDEDKQIVQNTPKGEVKVPYAGSSAWLSSRKNKENIKPTKDVTNSLPPPIPLSRNVSALNWAPPSQTNIGSAACLA